MSKGIRRLIARGLLAAIYLSLAAFAFYTGRGHTIYAENRDSTVPATVILNGFKPVTVKPNGIRIVGVVHGQSAEVRIDYPTNGTPFIQSFNLPIFADSVSMPVDGLIPGKLLLVAPAPQGIEEK